MWVYARVAVARPFPEPLTYAVPAHLSQVGLGHAVLVPLGSVGETGYIVERIDETDVPPDKVRPISRLLDPEPAFDAEQLAFYRWIAGYYLVPLGMVIHTATPSQMAARVVRVAVHTEAGVDALASREADGDKAQVLREVIARPGLTRRGLSRRLREELESKVVSRTLDALVRQDWVTWTEREIGEVRGRIVTVDLAVPAEALSTLAPRAGPRMKAVVARLADGPMDLSDLLAQEGASAGASLRRLQELGIVVRSERERRDILSDAPPMGASTPPVPNADQAVALDTLTAPGVAGPHLLFGVTGSGKTEVFLGAARTAMDRGMQVLVLVPEIGLTPQLVGRFRARFGDGVAVLHSQLTGTERLAHWRAIRAGEAKVAVGARSALFAPFQNLGLIVVDEEHDDSYKQSEGVPYNARDLAVVLGRKAACPVVLASATPSLESWHNALTGRYALLRLPKRATPRPVPKVEVVDLTQVDVPAGTTRPLLAPEVEAALRDTFARGGQAIVLYNRRGYATMVECTVCGSSYECPNCGITMTLHKRIHRVVCHYCGLKRNYVSNCGVCGGVDTLQELGKGTERIEETIAELFPDVAVARMDADTTSARGAHARILDRFRRGETQLLVGTQIIAKGHDFPGVHTAVVISADHGFRMPDFRAAERTYALLVQVAGRAGRGDHPGRVFVQTYQPDHYVLTHLDDVDGFLAAELRLRRALRYPPVARLCLVRLDGVDRSRVVEVANALGRSLRNTARGCPGVRVLGPAAAALPRLVGRWRFQIVLRGEQLGDFRRYLHAVHPDLLGAPQRGVRVHWDVDPRHLM
ncbi:MAG: primosomal protein N' (replication factor Y) [Myxococcota bacterium]|jgi:primosomal protein N' (replication factor Y)